MRQQTRLMSTRRSLKETMAPGNEYVSELCTCHRKYNQPFKTVSNNVGCNKHHLAFHPSELDIVRLYAASHRVHTHIQTWNQNKQNALLREDRRLRAFHWRIRQTGHGFCGFTLFLCAVPSFKTSHRDALSPCSLFFYHITCKAVK